MKSIGLEFADGRGNAIGYLGDAPIDGKKILGWIDSAIAEQYVYAPLFGAAEAVYACHVNFTAQDPRVLEMQRLFATLGLPEADGRILVPDPSLILSHPLAHLLCGSFVRDALPETEKFFTLGWFWVFPREQLPLVLRTLSIMAVCLKIRGNPPPYVRALTTTARQMARQGKLVVFAEYPLCFTLVYPEDLDVHVRKAEAFVNKRYPLIQGYVDPIHYPDYIPELLFNLPIEHQAE